MAGAMHVPSLDHMPTIVIAGGGIAGLEALIALHGHLGSTVDIELLDKKADIAQGVDPLIIRALDVLKAQ